MFQALFCVYAMAISEIQAQLTDSPQQAYITLSLLFSGIDPCLSVFQHNLQCFPTSFPFLLGIYLKHLTFQINS